MSPAPEALDHPAPVPPQPPEATDASAMNKTTASTLSVTAIVISQRRAV